MKSLKLGETPAQADSENVNPQFDTLPKQGVPESLQEIFMISYRNKKKNKQRKKEKKPQGSGSLKSLAQGRCRHPADLLRDVGWETEGKPRRFAQKPARRYRDNW